MMRASASWFAPHLNLSRSAVYTQFNDDGGQYFLRNPADKRDQRTHPKTEEDMI